MRKYQSHKIVSGAKVVKIRPWPTENGFTLTDEFGDEHRVDDSFFSRGMIEEGDYLVEYEDGYLSWSPKTVFEAGNKPLDEVDRPVGINTRIAMQGIMKDANDQHDMSGFCTPWIYAWQDLVLAADRLDAMMARSTLDLDTVATDIEVDAEFVADIEVATEKMGVVTIWVPTNNAGEMPVRTPGDGVTLVVEEALHFESEFMCMNWCNIDLGAYYPQSCKIDVIRKS